MAKYRVTWDGRYSGFSSIVEADSEAACYGMSGEFFFEQGGHHDMPFPSDVELIDCETAEEQRETLTGPNEYRALTEEERDELAEEFAAGHVTGDDTLKLEILEAE